MDIYSTTNNFSRAKRHVSFVSVSSQQPCGHVLRVPLEERCVFVNETPACHEMTRKVDYVNFLFCTMNFWGTVGFYLGIAILIVFALVLLYVMYILIDKIYTVVIVTIGKYLHASNYATGVIIISFAFSLPNVYGSFKPDNYDTRQYYNGALGTVLIDLCVILALVIIIKPHRVVKRFIFRDTFFVLLSVFSSSLYFSNQHMGIVGSIYLIGIYMVFFIIVIFEVIILRRHYRAIKTNTSVQQQVKNDLQLKAGGVIVFLSPEAEENPEVDLNKIEEHRFTSYYNLDNKGNEHFIDQFLGDVLDFEHSFSNPLGFFRNCIEFLGKIVLPKSDYKQRAHGWSKLLRMINIALLPCVILYILGDFTYWYIAVIVSAFLDIIIFFSSKTDQPPKYNAWCSILCYGAFTFIILGIMSEVENIMTTIGTVLNFQDETIGHLFIAWSDAIPDLFLMVTLSRKGYFRMAFAACYGNAIFQTSIDFGIRFLVRNVANNNSLVNAGGMGPTLNFFILLTTLLFAVAVAMTDYNARRSVGCFLLTIYGIFFVFSLLVDWEIMHGYGTDHDDEIMFHD